MSGPETAGSTGTRGSEHDAAGPGIVSVAIGLLGAGLIVVEFLAWNWLCLPVRGQRLCAEAIGVVSGWAGFGIAAGVAACALVLWEALSLAGALVLADRATEPRVAAGLGLAALVFALLRVLTRMSGVTPYAWLGLALSACLFAVAAARLLAAGRKTDCADDGSFR